VACASGLYKTGARSGPCQRCPDARMRTAVGAAFRLADCDCAAPAWEPDALGPTTANVSCLATCAPGVTRDASGPGGACAVCRAGTYSSSDRRNCSLCPAPLVVSGAGSTERGNCSCPAGLLDNHGTDYVYVASVGAPGPDDLNVTRVCEGGGGGHEGGGHHACVVPADPALRLSSIALTPVANATLRDVTVRVTHLGGALTLYSCTTDCAAGRALPLDGLLGLLSLTATNLAGATLAQHTRRTARFSTRRVRNATAFWHVQAEAVVLRHGLRVGDALWVPATTPGAGSCEPCLQGLASL